MNKNNTGRNSLIISVVGLIIIQVLITFKYLGSNWHILLAGFEAATVGGFADWFAVKALFREIPIPLISRHTNIIVKNRNKISNSIVDLVTNEWLSPIVIKSKIASISISDKLIVYLKNLDKKTIDSLLEKISFQIKKTDLNKFINKKITEIAIGKPLGNFLKTQVNSKTYNKLWFKVLDALQKTIHTEETKRILGVVLESQLNSYKEESLAKSLLITLGKGYKAIDTKSIVNKLIETFDTFIENAKTDPNSTVKLKIDTYFIEFSEQLNNNDPKAQEFLKNIKESLLRVNWNELINQISTSKSFDLTAILNNQLQKILIDLEKNETAKVKINNYIIAIIENFLSQGQTFIGNMVLDSLNKLDNKALVSQIEDKVGDDLQYIRLNGAIVGGFVGVIIALSRLLLNLL